MRANWLLSPSRSMEDNNYLLLLEGLKSQLARLGATFHTVVVPRVVDAIQLLPCT